MKGTIQQLIFDRIHHYKKCLDTPCEIERREVSAKIEVLNDIAREIREIKSYKKNGENTTKIK